MQKSGMPPSQLLLSAQLAIVLHDLLPMSTIFTANESCCGGFFFRQDFTLHRSMHTPCERAPNHIKKSVPENNLVSGVLTYKSVRLEVS